MARTFFDAAAPILPRHLNHLQESTLEAVRQLRLALGTGLILYGLGVEPTRGNALLVSPGLAFDGDGDALALAQATRVAPPSGDGPHVLAIAYEPRVEERSETGAPVIEGDGVRFHWLTTLPPDDMLVALATVRRDAGGRLVVDGRIARRAAPLDHRHSGAVAPDQAGRLRSTGAPTPESELAVRPADLNLALERLRSELLARIEALASGPVPVAPPPPPDPVPAGWEPELELIYGIGENLARALAENGVRAIPDLLRQAATVAGRQALSRGSGIPPSRLETFVRLADFMRLHGVTTEYARLLHDAGFGSVGELGASNSDDLSDRLRRTYKPDVYNFKKPSPALMRAWLKEAAQLQPIIIEAG